MIRSMKRFAFLEDLFNHFVVIYVYISRLLLSTDNMYCTRPC